MTSRPQRHHVLSLGTKKATSHALSMDSKEGRARKYSYSFCRGEKEAQEDPMFHAKPLRKPEAGTGQELTSPQAQVSPNWAPSLGLSAAWWACWSITAGQVFLGTAAASESPNLGPRPHCVGRCTCNKCQSFQWGEGWE